MLLALALSTTQRMQIGKQSTPGEPDPTFPLVLCNPPRILDASCSASWPGVSRSPWNPAPATSVRRKSPELPRPARPAPPFWNWGSGSPRAMQTEPAGLRTRQGEHSPGSLATPTIDPQKINTYTWLHLPQPRVPGAILKCLLD